MEQTKQKIRKISKFIKGGLIVVRVFIIIAIVFGGIIMLVPLVQPEEVEKIRHLFEDNEIFLISFIVNIASDVPERYQMMIGGFILAGSMVAMLIFATKLGKLMDEMIHDDTPFNEAVSDRLRRYSWTMLILIVYNPLMALVAFLLMRLMYYIFEYGTFLQEKADETKRIQEEMIMSFAEITENKSEQTGKHVRRVAEYSKIIAKEMGLGNDEADRIRLASTMHDVGKLLIPAEILEKPARLTDEEFAEIKKHPGYGGELLNEVEGDVMHMARTVALEHHERPDGRGYPLGKKDEEISIEGKIVAVADVYDALTSRRSYKEAWHEDKAREEIMKGKGTQFDTKVVEAFDRAYPKINEVRLKLQDV